MKLVRFGEAGSETPGMLDADGTIRDLSGHVADITGATLDAATLDRLRGLDPASLPAVDGNVRLGAASAESASSCALAELFRSCGRNRC